MKILFSCLSQSWGGMEMYTLTTINQLLKKGISVELLCYPDSKLHKIAEGQKIVTYTLDAAGYVHPIQIIKLVKILRHKNYSIIHTQASKDLWILVPALSCVRSKTPLFFTKHIESFIVKKDLLHKFLYKRITIATAISNLIRKNLINTTSIPQDKIVLLHNGLDTELFNPKSANSTRVREEFNIKSDEIVIGMLARFTKGKGHEEFLFAAKQLVERYHNLRFLIVGEPSRGEDEYAEKIKNIAVEYELKNKIIFTGFRSDTVDVLAAMDIFAFPSHSEAFGMALLEAMAMEKPSVCSDGHGILDIAVDGITSFYFRTKDAKDLELKLEQLIVSEKKREQLGKNSRIRVLEYFDLDKIIDKTINIYKLEIGKIF
jgi:glycosyltransferase involved in cell wall biosynthesis